MNKCEQYCQTIKRMANAGGGGLPSEYQQVEYLRSSGTQYIDTGINANDGDILDISITFGAGNYYNKSVMGSQGDSDVSRRTAVMFGYENNMLSITSGNVTAGSSNTKFSTSTSSELQFTVNDQTKTISATRNGTALTQTLYGGNLAYASIYLFYNHRQASEQFATVSISYFKCVINNTRIQELIPCYRKSDNKPGMYDLVTNTFFTNAGTGEFTVGNNV